METTAHDGTSPQARPPLGLMRAPSAGDGRAGWTAIIWRQAVEQAQLVCLVVDRSGRLLEQSAAAASLLASGGGLRLQAGRLTARTPQDTEQLRSQIAVVALGREVQPPRTFNVGPLSLQVAPLGARAENAPHPRYSDCALILIRRRTRRRPPTAAAIRAQLQCTAAEAQVAAALAAGHSPRQIASQRQVSIHTIRAQVRALLAGTGTRRIGGLVALLGGL